MKVYISWSGNRSRIVARSLSDFISKILQAAIVFTSDEIRPGERWHSQLIEALKSYDVGIVCFTSDNRNSPWLIYEAGILSAHNKAFIPLLVDFSLADLTGPFAYYQAMTLTRSDMHKLIDVLNSKLPAPVSKEIMTRVFDAFYPEFEKIIAELPPPPRSNVHDEADTSPAQIRSDREILEEILELVRTLVVKQQPKED